TIVLTPPSPVVGGNVSLAPQPPPQDFVLCSWYRSATAAETSRILTCFPHTPLVQQNGPAHTGLETAGPGCALHITGLTLNDTGNYTVQIQSPTSPGLGTVISPAPLCHPRPSDGALGISPRDEPVLENGTFTLRCNSSPSADTVLWLRDGASLVPSDRLVLSPDNRTLTVLGVTRDDAGAYQCEVRNPVSTKRSEPGTVTVALTGDHISCCPSPGVPPSQISCSSNAFDQLWDIPWGPCQPVNPPWDPTVPRVDPWSLQPPGHAGSPTASPVGRTQWCWNSFWSEGAELYPPHPIHAPHDPLGRGWEQGCGLGSWGGCRQV
uniref:Ig-like domain-containing protein n=1 Tax=Gopherus evgoodei TaxID=1825980 RepID=A0A8C4WF72_9SAUR